MDLPVMPPVAPMLAKPVDAIPTGDFIFEPKWDGFRSIVFRDGDEVEIGSRNERPLTRYFPELVTAILDQLPPRCVIDGEIVLPDWDSGRLDFEALQLRLHPAESRVRLLAAQTPAHFVAFDLLALGDTSYLEVPFGERREALESALASADPPVHLTPATMDNETAAEWFSQFEGAGLDGLIAKPRSGAYSPDKRVMFKIKHDRTADCVVAGYRPHKTGDDAIGSLLLGLYRDSGELASVGVVGALPMSVRRELRAELDPLVTTFDGHPWNWAKEEAGTRTPRSSQYSRWNVGKDLSFVPLRPERVLEVRYDHMEGTRFRHTAQFVRWRPDRTPSSCTFSQLEEPVSYSLSEILSQDQLFRTDRGDCGGGCQDRRRGGGALSERVQSGEGVLSPDRAHQARPGAVLPGGRGRGAARGGRAADGAEAVRERGGGGAVLPEAGAELAAGLDLHRRASLPVRTHGRRGGADRRGRAGVGGQPRLHRPEPAPGAGRRPRPPGRAAGRPGPGAGRGVAADRGRGAGGSICSGGLRADRLGQDLGVAGHAHLRADLALVVVYRRAPVGGGGGARDRATCPRSGHVKVVEGGAARGLRRLQPERQGPDARVSTPLTWDEVPGCDPSLFTIDTVPARFASVGDPWEGMDSAVGSLAGLLELAAADEAAGLPDAPWPPNYEKQAGEAPRVQPSKRRSSGGKAADGAADATDATGAGAGAGADVAPSPTGRRKSTKPLIEIARASTKAEALEGLERWKARHPDVWPLLEARDVLTDSMRGRSSTWTRIRLNLEHVPSDQRPAQEPLEVDYDPWAGFQP